MEKKDRLISKGRYVDGVRCPRLIWFKFNRPDAFPPTDLATQLRFDYGHEVGRLAQKLYSDAIEIKWDINSRTVNARSLEALKTGKPLFEAGFIGKDTYSIADILEPVGEKKKGYDLIEVKMASEVKEYYIADVAFQKYNLEKAGIPIRKCYLLHVNTDYLYEGGDIDPGQFFIKADVTEAVDGLLPDIEGDLERFRKIISREEAPEITYSVNCNDPYECPLREECFKNIPRGSVMDLVGTKWEQRFDMWNNGNKMIVDIEMPDHPEKKNEIKQKIIQAALKENKPQIDRQALAEFLGGIEYPIYYLDFETLQLPVPRFIKTHPFDQIPFQFSLHIQKEKGGAIEHNMFLAPDASDPRPELMARLSKLIQKKGTIIAFNDSFEKRVLKEAAEALPGHADWYNKVLPWFVDLQNPFRQFIYYHPDQAGSYSLKYVYPALTGKSYKGLEIAEGGTAMAEFIRVTFYDVDKKDRDAVRKNLEIYCRQDTQAMIDILGKLQEEL